MVNVFTIILIIGITIVQILGYNQQGSLLTSGAMALFLSFEAFSAQASSPEPFCNPFIESSN